MGLGAPWSRYKPEDVCVECRQRSRDQERHRGAAELSARPSADQVLGFHGYRQILSTIGQGLVGCCARRDSDTSAPAWPVYSGARGQAELIVDAVASVGMFFLERDAPSTGLQNFGDALYWTTAQLTTPVVAAAEPADRGGKVITVVLDVYAITMVSTLAGMFNAFFYRRGEERDRCSAALHPERDTSSGEPRCLRGA